MDTRCRPSEIRVAASVTSPPASTKVEMRSKGGGDEQGRAEEDE